MHFIFMKSAVDEDVCLNTGQPLGLLPIIITRGSQCSNGDFDKNAEISDHFNGGKNPPISLKGAAFQECSFDTEPDRNVEIYSYSGKESWKRFWIKYH